MCRLAYLSKINKCAGWNKCAGRKIHIDLINVQVVFLILIKVALKGRARRIKVKDRMTKYVQISLRKIKFKAKNFLKSIIM